MLGIYEYDEVYCEEAMNGDTDAMHAYVKTKQEILQKTLMKCYPTFHEYPVLAGIESGFNECDEIAIFIPMPVDLAKDNIAEAEEIFKCADLLLEKEKLSFETFEDFMQLFDDWNRIARINDDNLTIIVEDRIDHIMETRKDLYPKKVRVFGFYDEMLIVRLLDCPVAVMEALSTIPEAYTSNHTSRA